MLKAPSLISLDLISWYYNAIVGPMILYPGWDNIYAMVGTSVDTYAMFGISVDIYAMFGICILVMFVV